MSFFNKISCIIIIFNLLLSWNIHADGVATGIDYTNDGLDSTLDYISSIVDQISCEAQGISSTFIRSELSHTCLAPIAMSEEALYSLLSPWMWSALKMKLKVNYDKLDFLKDSNGKGQCHISNRADFNNPRIKFGLCNNTLLKSYQIASPVFIVIDLIKGKSFIDALLDNIIVDPHLYHTGEYPMVEGHVNGAKGDWGLYLDIAPPNAIPWKVITHRDQISVATLSAIGWIPVGSKLIKEPYPNSKYDNVQSTGCQSINECFADIDSKSKVMMGFSAKIVECTRQMMTRALIDPNLCNNLTGNYEGSTGSSLLYDFQKSMYKTVSALLTLYIMFFGFNILITGGQTKKSELITFVVKFVLVIYFSIGVTVKGVHYDGISTYLLPLMIYGGNQLSGIMMEAGSTASNGLCLYTASDYDTGFAHLAMWDALDCRVWHYLGLQGFFSLLNTSGHDFLNAMYTPVPFYLIMIVPAFWFGHIQLALMLLTFPFMVIGVAIYSVQAYIICIICILLLGILAPIFVPMALFDYTKGYFESWYKMILSFILQPMVVTTFMVIMFNIFDQTFNHTCKFYSSESNGKKTFIMDNDPDHYSSQELLECTKSLGFIFTPGAMLSNSTPIAALSTAAIADGSFSEMGAYKEANPMLGMIQESKGLFTSGNILNPKAVSKATKGVITDFYQFITHIMFEMLAAIIMLYVMKSLAEQISEFAADITEGVSLSQVTMSPGKLNELKDKASDLINKSKAGGDSVGHEASVSRSSGVHEASASGGSSGHEASSGGKD